MERKTRVFGLTVLALLVLASLGCSGAQKAAPPAQAASKAATTPTLAFQAFHTAVCQNDLEAFRKCLAQAQVKEFEKQSVEKKLPPDTALKFCLHMYARNTDFTKQLPETRNEAAQGEKASLEFRMANTKDWNVCPFTKEGNEWKVDLRAPAPPEGPPTADAAIAGKAPQIAPSHGGMGMGMGGKKAVGMGGKCPVDEGGASGGGMELAPAHGKK